MEHVFLSYHHADADFATVLSLELEKSGHTVWRDTTISPGSDWRAAIDGGIQTAKALVVVMSPEAAESEYVTYEWAFALGRGISVIPVVLRACTLHPRLEALQYLDFSTPSARPWSQLLTIVQKQDTDGPDIPRGREQTSLVDKAIAALDSLDPQERLVALETLGHSSDPDAQRAVRTTLQHSLLDVRVRAAVLVAPTDPSIALPALVEGLAFGINDDRDLWFAVKRALVDIGSDAVRPVAEALGSSKETICDGAAKILGEIRDETAVPDLLAYLARGRKGGFLDARASVVQALGQIGSADAVAALIEVVSDRRENEYTIRDAIWSLGQIGSTDSTPFLIEQLPRQPRQTQTLIVVVLGLLGDERAVPALAEFLTDKDPADDGLSKVSTKPMREHAADALRRIGSSSALALLKS